MKQLIANTVLLCVAIALVIVLSYGYTWLTTPMVSVDRKPVKMKQTEWADSSKPRCNIRK